MHIMNRYLYMQPDLPSAPASVAPPAAPDPMVTFEPGEYLEVNWPGQAARRLILESLRFVDPDFTATQLRDGGWTDVEISGGMLAGLDVTRSSLRRVRFGRGRLSGLVVVEAELRDVTFVDAKLDLANFRHAKLKNVEFRNCELTGASFSGSHLTDVKFTNCDLTRAEFSGAKHQRTDLRSSTLAEILGLSGLAGATISTEQMVGLLPEFAAALEIKVEDN